MGTYTTNLNLYNTDMNTDGNDTFDFQRDLNDNNNKIDSAIGNLSNLTTEQQANLVSAINEIVSNLDGKTSKSLNDLNAVGQAILDKKVEVEALLAQNGYAKFSWKENNEISNLIMQWGFNYYSAQTITFPIAFSNDIYSVIATTCDNNIGTVCTISTNTPTNTGINVKTNYVQQGAPAYVVNSSLPYNWFAIGY